MTSSSSSNGCRRTKRSAIQPPEISEPRRCYPTSNGKTSHLYQQLADIVVLEMRHRRKIVGSSCLMWSTLSRGRLSEQCKILNSEPSSANASSCRIESLGKFPFSSLISPIYLLGPRKTQVRLHWSASLPQNWPLFLPLNKTTSSQKTPYTNSWRKQVCNWSFLFSRIVLILILLPTFNLLSILYLQQRKGF